MPIRPAVSARHRIAKTGAFFTEQCIRAELDAVESEIAGIAGMNAQLFGDALDADSRSSSASMRNALTPRAPASPVRNIPMITPA